MDSVSVGVDAARCRLLLVVRHLVSAVGQVSVVKTRKRARADPEDSKHMIELQPLTPRYVPSLLGFVRPPIPTTPMIQYVLILSSLFRAVSVPNSLIWQLCSILPQTQAIKDFELIYRCRCHDVVCMRGVV